MWTTKEHREELFFFTRESFVRQEQRARKARKGRETVTFRAKRRLWVVLFFVLSDV